MISYKIVFHILNIWIVTDSRVLDIWQIAFFNRKVSELHLESIQDISVNTSGIVQSYFNFGNIDIQTAASAQHFTFEEVPDPLDIKDSIMNAANVYTDSLKK
jgi:Bacterial PH domain